MLVLYWITAFLFTLFTCQCSNNTFDFFNQKPYDKALLLIKSPRIVEDLLKAISFQDAMRIDSLGFILCCILHAPERSILKKMQEALMECKCNLSRLFVENDSKYLITRMIDKRTYDDHVFLPEENGWHAPTELDFNIQKQEIDVQKALRDNPADFFMALMNVSDEAKLKTVLSKCSIKAEFASGWIALMLLSQVKPPSKLLKYLEGHQMDKYVRKIVQKIAKHILVKIPDAADILFAHQKLTILRKLQSSHDYKEPAEFIVKQKEYCTLLRRDIPKNKVLEVLKLIPVHEGTLKLLKSTMSFLAKRESKCMYDVPGFFDDASKALLGTHLECRLMRKGDDTKAMTKLKAHILEYKALCKTGHFEI